MRNKVFCLGFMLFGLLLISKSDHASAFSAGQDQTLRKSYSWAHIDYNAARKKLKPILLYMYDEGGKNAHIAQNFENKILKNGGMKKLGSQLTCVFSGANTTDWPIKFSSAAKSHGAILCVLNCDGSNGVYLNNYTNDKIPGAFIAKVKDVIQKNKTFAANVKRNPPLDWEHPTIRKYRLEREKEAKTQNLATPKPIPGLDNKNAGSKEKNKSKKNKPAPLLLDEE